MQILRWRLFLTLTLLGSLCACRAQQSVTTSQAGRAVIVKAPPGKAGEQPRAVTGKGTTLPIGSPAESY
jgi:hypothetical protein